MAEDLLKVRALAQQFREGTITLHKRAAKPKDDGDGNDGEPDADEDDRSYDIAISTESEVERWYGVEVLAHDASAIDMTRLKRGAAVLVDHWGDQVGVVESARLDDDKVLRGVIRFSKSQRGQDVERDVRDGIRQNVSVGYFVKDMVLAEKRGEVKVYRATRWQPAEVSIVSVPADVQAGVGRDQSRDELFPVNITGGEAAKEERSMDPKELAKQQEQERAALAQVQKDGETKRADEIIGMCKENGLERLAAQFIESGVQPEVVAERIAKLKETVGKAQSPDESLRAVAPEKDLRNFSYVRALRGAVALAEGGKFDGLEREVSDHLRSVMPKVGEDRGGVIVPVGRAAGATLDSLTTAKGTELVPETQGAMIEFLRPVARVIQSGATVLTGLTGPVAFPKQTGAATVYWVPENPSSNVLNGEPSLGLALLQPKTLMGNIPFTRQLLMQASLDIEAWARNELAIAHGLAIDYSAIHGSGVNGQPTGIYAAPSVFSQDFSSSSTNLTLANLLLMVSGIFDKNAQAESMRWLTTPILAGSLRGKAEFPANTLVASGQTLWQGRLDEGTMLGYKSASTTQVSKTMSASAPTGSTSHGLVFGNFADMFVAMFGAMELVVDPYSLKKQGVIEVTTFQMADTLIRHGESFAKGINITP